MVNAMGVCANFIMSEIFDKIHNTANAVAKITKNNAKLSSLSVALEKKYALLGKIVYGTVDGCKDKVSEEIAELIKEKDALKDEIEKMLKIKRCPNCGAEIPDKNHYSVYFCNNCGAKLPDEPTSNEDEEKVSDSETKSDEEASECHCGRSNKDDSQHDEAATKDADKPCNCEKENTCVEKKEEKNPLVRKCKLADLPRILEEIDAENKKQLEEKGSSYSHHKFEVDQSGIVTITKIER